MLKKHKWNIWHTTEGSLKIQYLRFLLVSECVFLVIIFQSFKVIIMTFPSSQFNPQNIWKFYVLNKNGKFYKGKSTSHKMKFKQYMEISKLSTWLWRLSIILFYHIIRFYSQFNTFILHNSLSISTTFPCAPNTQSQGLYAHTLHITRYAHSSSISQNQNTHKSLTKKDSCQMMPPSTQSENNNSKIYQTVTTLLFIINNIIQEVWKLYCMH